MTNKLDKETIGFIKSQMESVVKDIVSDYRNSSEDVFKKIGEFKGMLYLLANSGHESLGLKIKVIIPTMQEYEESLPDKDDSN